jgi:hypothetical protein
VSERVTCYPLLLSLLAATASPHVQMSIGRAVEVNRPAGGPPQLASCAVLAVVCAVISLWSPSPVIQVPSIQAPDALILRSSPAPEEGDQECEAPVQVFIPPASPTRDTRRMACPGVRSSAPGSESPKMAATCIRCKCSQTRHPTSVCGGRLDPNRRFSRSQARPRQAAAGHSIKVSRTEHYCSSASLAAH